MSEVAQAIITAREVISVLPRILIEEPTLKYEIYAILEEHFPPKKEFNRILEEIEKSREETNKRFAEAREESNKRFEAVDKRFAEAREESNKRFEAVDKRFEAVDKRFEAVDKRFDEVDKRFDSVDKRFDEVHKEIKKTNKTLGALQHSVERMTLTIEDESREVLNYMLKQKNIDITVDRFEIEGKVEIDIYGCNEDLCVIGECKTRAGIKVLEDLENDMEKLKMYAPEKIKKGVIKFIYAISITPDLVEEAKKQGVWIMKGQKELTEFTIDKV